MSAKKEDRNNAISKCECCFCCLLLHMGFFFLFSLGYFLTGNFVCGYFLQCIGKVGKVQGFAANGDAIISFGNKKYRLYPGALKKVRLACMCLWVVVCSNCPLRFGKCDADMCLWGVRLNCPLRLGKMWLWHVSVGCLFKLSSETWKNVTLTCACGLLSVQTVPWDLKQCDTDMCLWVVSVWTVIRDFETCKTDMCLWVVSVQTVVWDLQKCDTDMCLWVTVCSYCPLRFGKMWHSHVPVGNMPV